MRIRRVSKLAAAFAVVAVVASGVAGAEEGEKGKPMSEARGSFEVKVTPAADEKFSDGTSLGRYTLAKEIHGDIEGTSRGEMLAGGTSIEGSGGYVAMERIEGALHGRRGSFLLQHVGTMTKAGGYEMRITVVPDSGTGDLVGLSGSFEILFVGKRHDYRFVYSLAPSDAPVR